MRKSFLTAAAAIAAAGFMSIGSTPASAGPFCATYPEGQGFRSCNYVTYNQCARTIRGAGGQCVSNPNFAGYGGYEDSYAYAPGPPYTAEAMDRRYYSRPGVGIYIGGGID